MVTNSFFPFFCFSTVGVVWLLLLMINTITVIYASKKYFKRAKVLPCLHVSICSTMYFLFYLVKCFLISYDVTLGYCRHILS